MQKVEMLEKELEDKSITCCFTGHRPDSLPWGYDEDDQRCLDMKVKLKEEIVKAINDGYTNFISGMALGFDMICAETVLELKKEYPHIKLYGAIPCKDQDFLWKPLAKERYKKLCSQLDGERCIFNKYVGGGCMIERNEFMVNHSSLIIALFNGTGSGTKKTLNYGKKRGVKTIIITP